MNCIICNKEIPSWYKKTSQSCSVWCRTEVQNKNNMRAYYKRQGIELNDKELDDKYASRRKKGQGEFKHIYKPVHTAFEHINATQHAEDWYNLYKSKNRMTRIVANEEWSKYKVYERIPFDVYVKEHDRIERLVRVYSAEDVIYMVSYPHADI